MNSLQKKILDYVQSGDYKPRRPRELARHLNLRRISRHRFEEAVQGLVDKGHLHQARNGSLWRPDQVDQATKERETKRKHKKKDGRPDLIQGMLRRTQSGDAWLIPHPDGRSGQISDDVFLFEEDLADAQNGDEVLVSLTRRRRSGGRRCGRVEEIVERATHTFVGTYFEEDGEGLVRVDGGLFRDPVTVGDPGARGAQPDDKVVIEMIRFPTHARPGEAVLTRILGARDKPGVDELAVIHEFGLPQEFPEAVLEEARAQAEAFDESDLGHRLDLTDETIITIDPVDARDFDDAISLKQTDDGHWHLGVHIADVGHFVRPGSELDREARRRSTSVYLPGRVIPMLPETISNALASLQKGKVRFTKSVFIEFTEDGIPVHTEFQNTAIKVARRFAYEQVMPIVRDPDSFRKKVPGKVRRLLIQMHELAMRLRKRRLEDGALELHLPEVQIELNKRGEVVGAHEAEHDESHQMIEEFMLAANIAVATELDDRHITFLRRTHGSPDPVKLNSFAEFVRSLNLKLERYASRFELQELIHKVKGKPFEQAVNFSLLRSMQQAEYSGTREGHYALAVDHYCHFTSPIRRYPDLTVHRIINAIIQGKKKKAGPERLEVLKLGSHCSTLERRAADAERELRKIKLLTLMAKRGDEVFDARVTMVRKFGIFCRCEKFPVDGFVPISRILESDYLDFDRTTCTLTGRRSGKVIRLGDCVRVRVATVDPDERILEWELIQGSRRGGAKHDRKKTKSKKDGKKKPRRKDSGSSREKPARKRKQRKRRPKK